MAQLTLDSNADGVRLSIRAKPKSSRSKVLRVREGALDVAIAAPPVDGAANSELVKTLARFFGVPKSSIAIVSGSTARAKRVQISGATPRQLRDRAAEHGIEL